MANQKLAYINDPDVWEFICGLSNFSSWVRDQARKEMKKQAGIDPELAVYFEELLNRKLGGRVIEPAIIPTNDFNVDSSGFL